MFDTMTMTKAVAAGCGALLVFMLGGWAASAIYTTGSGAHHGEGEEVTVPYSIDTGATAGPAAEEEVIDIAALMASADPAAGEKVFSKCKACHHLDGKDATGPHLNGVIGREIGSAPGFAYSASMVAHQPAVWDEENFFAFIGNPKAFAADTKMKFAGIPKPQDRADLLKYLETTQ